MAFQSLPSYRSGKNSYRHAKPMSEINVTPFVDVMLVLLVIFMVTAPLLTVGIPVDMPKTSGQNINPSKEMIEITVNREGKIFLQETPLILPELIERLKAIRVTQPNLRIILRGDRATDYGTVVEVAGAITNAGFPHITLRTQQVAAP
ncbi:MAG TPA: ExbD/TolR family protein [Alphaproteobacteria bacterium]|nr:ExbD/TolR family protein [Alphaproteobacteria bacterium]